MTIEKEKASRCFYRDQDGHCNFFKKAPILDRLRLPWRIFTKEHKISARPTYLLKTEKIRACIANGNIEEQSKCIGHKHINNQKPQQD